jgi:hypothetical protein
VQLDAREQQRASGDFSLSACHSLAPRLSAAVSYYDFTLGAVPRKRSLHGALSDSV